jgi:hypothetical protein
VPQAALSSPHELMPNASAKPTSLRKKRMSAASCTNYADRGHANNSRPCRSSVPACATHRADLLCRMFRYG